MRLQGKIAVITGAASGIGHETAKRFAREGAAVIVADRDTTKAQAVAQELQEAGAISEAVGCDVSVEADVKALLARVVDGGWTIR